MNTTKQKIILIFFWKNFKKNILQKQKYNRRALWASRKLYDLLVFDKIFDKRESIA